MRKGPCHRDSHDDDSVESHTRAPQAAMPSWPMPHPLWGSGAPGTAPSHAPLGRRSARCLARTSKLVSRSPPSQRRFGAHLCLTYVVGPTGYRLSFVGIRLSSS